MWSRYVESNFEHFNLASRSKSSDFSLDIFVSHLSKWCLQIWTSHEPRKCCWCAVFVGSLVETSFRFEGKKPKWMVTTVSLQLEQFIWRCCQCFVPLLLTSCSLLRFRVITVLNQWTSLSICGFIADHQSENHYIHICTRVYYIPVVNLLSHSTISTSLDTFLETCGLTCGMENFTHPPCGRIRWVFRQWGTYERCWPPVKRSELGALFMYRGSWVRWLYGYTRYIFF